MVLHQNGPTPPFQGGDDPAITYLCASLLMFDSESSSFRCSQQCLRASGIGRQPDASVVKNGLRKKHVNAAVQYKNISTPPAPNRTQHQGTFTSDPRLSGLSPARDPGLGALLVSRSGLVLGFLVGSPALGISVFRLLGRGSKRGLDDQILVCSIGNGANGSVGYGAFMHLVKALNPA